MYLFSLKNTIAGVHVWYFNFVRFLCVSYKSSFQGVFDFQGSRRFYTFISVRNLISTTFSEFRWVSVYVSFLSQMWIRRVSFIFGFDQQFKLNIGIKNTLARRRKRIAQNCSTNVTVFLEKHYCWSTRRIAKRKFWVCRWKSSPRDGIRSQVAYSSVD